MKAQFSSLSKIPTVIHTALARRLWFDHFKVESLKASGVVSHALFDPNEKGDEKLLL